MKRESGKGNRKKRKGEREKKKRKRIREKGKNLVKSSTHYQSFKLNLRHFQS